MQLALDDWTKRFGFVLAKDVDYLNTNIDTVARYVAKYAVKGVFEDPFRFAPKPSETFSAFFKRIRQDLHIPNGCFPYLFFVSHFAEDGAGLSPRFAVLLQGFVFGRSTEAEMCNNPWI